MRVDTHIYEGYVVPPHYDSLIAKFVVHDVNRDAALRRMRRCLDEFVVEGVATNIPFLRRLTENPEYCSGVVDTGLVGRMLSSVKP